MAVLTDADDELHVPASPDRWWSETYWFSIDEPGADLSATIYPVFRPNLGICSLAIAVWDGTAHEPWAVPYYSCKWHLAMPATSATSLELEGLRYQRLEPLRRYRVSYTDGDELTLDLEYTGFRPPHEAGIAHGLGHFDQACRVVGELVMRSRRHAIDTVAMRDRTWSVRSDDRRGSGTGYTYGIGSAAEQFLLLTTLDGNTGSFVKGVFGGYLVRDGVEAPLIEASRRVVARKDGYPVRIELEATDSLGRRLEAVATTRNRLANQANPAQFAWMSMAVWDVAGVGELVGEDQEVWSPDRLRGALSELATR